MDNIASWSARGCKTSNPVVSLPVDNPVPGGLYYKEGDLVTITLNNITRLYGPKYFVTDFPQLKKIIVQQRKICIVQKKVYFH